MRAFSLEHRHRMSFRLWLRFIRSMKHIGKCDDGCHNIFVLKEGTNVKVVQRPKFNYNLNYN